MPREVIVVCSPTVEHHRCVLEGINRLPLAVIVEKPLCLELEHASDILLMLSRHPVFRCM